MQVILLEKIVNLGGLGDVVRVKDGFARNFLIPQRKARRATDAAIAEFEAKRADLEKAAAEKLAAAQAQGEKLGDGIEALVEGLQAFPGTLILVSHDRWFVSEVATRIIEIRSDGIEDYRGNYAEYVAHTADDHLDIQAVADKAKKDQRVQKKSKKEASKERRG